LFHQRRYHNILSIVPSVRIIFREEAEKEVVKVPARNTSQICSSCGRTVQKDLSCRVHSCPFCGLIIDRDTNAARNVLRLGQILRGAEALASAMN